MAKKTARATGGKSGQQRSKEEQWRKRMATQARTGATAIAPAKNGAGSAVAEPEDEVLDGGTAATTPRVDPTPSAGARTATAPRTQSAAPTRTGAVPAAARRPVTPRGRLAQANTMTIEEEMHFIKRDISKLVVLTVGCLVILIILAFIVPSIVK